VTPVGARLHEPKSQIQLKEKDDMKRRGLASPDLGDTLAMPFAVRPSTRRFQPRDKVDYSVFRRDASLLWMG